MKLTGWNDIPRGYGASFETKAAPLWLRVLYATPFVDRFAYPLLVRRGLGVLTPHPGASMADRDEVTGGWRIEVSSPYALVNQFTADVRLWPFRHVSAVQMLGVRKWWRYRRRRQPRN